MHFRLKQTETIQYFQFDEAGNMFCFEPGAGCSGIPWLVRPGDEFIFSSCETSYDSQLTETKTEAEPTQAMETVEFHVVVIVSHIFTASLTLLNHESTMWKFLIAIFELLKVRKKSSCNYYYII